MQIHTVFNLLAVAYGIAALSHDALAEGPIHALGSEPFQPDWGPRLGWYKRTTVGLKNGNDGRYHSGYTGPDINVERKRILKNRRMKKGLSLFTRQHHHVFPNLLFLPNGMEFYNTVMRGDFGLNKLMYDKPRPLRWG